MSFSLGKRQVFDENQTAEILTHLNAEDASLLLNDKNWTRIPELRCVKCKRRVVIDEESIVLFDSEKKRQIIFHQDCFLEN